MVGAPDSLVTISIFPLLQIAEFPQPVNFLLVLVLLIVQLVEFEVKVVNIFSGAEALVALSSNVSLSLINLQVLSGDLVTTGSNILLQVVVASVLFVEKEPEVINLLFELMHRHTVHIVLSFEVVILQQLLVLKKSVLLLQAIELVSQSKVVLVPLLDFEDLGLQLANEQVFLI